jgi:hypothetical protein
MKPLRSIEIALLLVSLGLAACGSDGDGDPAGAPVHDGGLEDGAGANADPSAEPDAQAQPTWRETCAYPANNGFIELGKSMPSLAWEGAYLSDGTRLDLELHAFHCAPEFDAYRTALFAVSAGWCPACPSQIEHLASLAGALEAAGSLLVFVETQTADGLPATHEDSHAYVERVLGPGGPGLRVGDGETLPRALAIDRAPLVTSYPAGFVVRRSDMMVIASQSQSASSLPWDEIARHPDSVRETSNPNDTPNCGPDDEEPYEPNNTAAQAARLVAPARFRGGICDGFPDYFFIDSNVRWLLEIDFEHSVGDLDMFVWDVENDEILTDALGRPVGSATVDDREVYQGRGPTIIVIFGYSGATSTYELWLAEIG